MKNALACRPVVLVVDDEPLVLASLGRLFRKEPLDLRTTTDPEQALELIRREPVRILLTDQRMPGMTGTDLVARARAEAPGITCLILTAFPDSDVLERCLREQLDGVLLKPCEDEQVRGVVRRLLRDDSRPSLAWGPEQGTIEADCAGATTRILCRSITMSLLKPSCRQMGATILLENVGQLHDSIARFFKELHRLLQIAGRTTLIVDRSGQAVAFWSAIGEAAAVVGNGQSGAVLVKRHG